MAIMRAGQLVNFPIQPGDGVYGIAVQTCFAFAVTRQFRNTGAQRVHHGAGAAFLIGQLIALHQQTLHHRRRNRLFFTQRRQGVFGRCALIGSQSSRSFGIGGLGHALPQNRIRVKACKISLAPAAEQQLPLGTAQVFANFAIPRGLFGLPDQHRQLLRQPLQHIIDAQQVRLGPRQLQLGLVPAGIKATDPCGLFQNPASGFGFGIDQFGNLPLSHQSRRMRSR